MKFTPLRMDTAKIDFNFATLTDTKGNRQEIFAKQGSRIIIAPGGVDPMKTIVTATPTAIPANGVSTSLITVIPRDAPGDTLPQGQIVQISSTSPGKLLGEIKSHPDGSYTQLLQSPVVPGKSKITAIIDITLYNSGRYHCVNSKIFRGISSN